MDTRRIRRLKEPLALAVEPDDDGIPRRIRLGSEWLDVTLARKPWRIDQQWWRSDHILRDYFRVALPEGPALTIYHDQIGGEWARQEY